MKWVRVCQFEITSHDPVPVSCSNRTVWANPYRVVHSSSLGRPGLKPGWYILNLAFDTGREVWVYAGPYDDRAQATRPSLDLYRIIKKAEHYYDSRLFDPIRGRDLSCTCATTEPCHVDILLELANWS